MDIISRNIFTLFLMLPVFALAESTDMDLGAMCTILSVMDDKDVDALKSEMDISDVEFAQIETLCDSSKGAQSADILARDEIGAIESGVVVPVDLDFITSGEKPVVGELWTIFGEITNRSNQPIWIVDVSTVLMVPPEVWGSTSVGGSIGAFLPTVRPRPTSELIRIEPGLKYVVTWKIDTWRSHDTSGGIEGWSAIFSRIGVTIRDFLFYKPGEYSFSALVHVWATPPQLDHLGQVLNFGDSFTESETRKIYVEASPWVLIIGSIIGGLLAFFLKLIFILTKDSFRSIGGIKYLAFGICSAILLCSIGTILIARVSASEFLVTIQVKDLWGAMATGFFLQWLGLNYFLSKITTGSDNSNEPTHLRNNDAEELTQENEESLKEHKGSHIES